VLPWGWTAHERTQLDIATNHRLAGAALGQTDQAKQASSLMSLSMVCLLVGAVMNIDTPDQGAATPSGIVHCVFHSAEENGTLRLNEDPVAMLGAYNDKNESSQR
jgi:hypothetical protein